MMPLLCKFDHRIAKCLAINVFVLGSRWKKITSKGHQYVILKGKARYSVLYRSLSTQTAGLPKGCCWVSGKHSAGKQAHIKLSGV